MKNGEAVYERDSVLFEEIQYSFPLLAILQQVGIESGGHLCVLDFGGSLGSSYYQNKGFISVLKKIDWCIVEQPNFVSCGKSYFENEQLKFFFSVEDCLALYQPNVLLLSGVLQCLENPYFWLDKLIRLKISYIVIDRTAFIENDKDILTIQTVPKNIYQASYPAWFFNIEKIKSKCAESYILVSQFDNGFTKQTIINGKKAYWNGLIFKIKT